ncbi:MAG: Gfo/Idh/MocA family oxidoreductase [Verrucomicrobiae bacterium]|nr:Gfo/Idh/MocA family oxidoreductase [Verrucomicrobiae bacterium]
MRRRRFLQATAAAAVGFQIVPRHVLGQGQTPPSEKLNIAGIGVGGQGGGVLNDLKSENIVALCDVDESRAAGTFNAFPQAARFKDYRVMLDKQKDFDAVMIATPDHMHAPIALAALRAGKHVYVEKPMAHTIEEARIMTRVARETGLVTQMGNNGHAGEGLRLTREWIQAGAIGTVREIHGWSDRAGRWWRQPAERPADTSSVPATLDWNLWLGAAPERPFHSAYHPFQWRGWFDFGTGALGDMAVHNLDPAFYALDLGAPIAAACESSALGRETYPAWQILTLEFAAPSGRPPLKVRWYDGGKMPPTPEHLGDEMDLADNGIYFVGDLGTMVCGGWSGSPKLFPESRRAAFKLPPKTIPRSPGHRIEWVQACKAGRPELARAGFAYSGPFTEALLVGNLATRLQRRIEWNAADMRATNAPEAEPLIRKSYRAGFGLGT